MGKKSLNLLLAENLWAEMAAQQISANALGAQSGVAARTIGNYLKKDPPKTSTGKDRSATLHAIDLLAAKLKISPLALLIDRSVVPIPLSAAEEKLLADYRALPKERREQVEALADGLQPWTPTSEPEELRTASPKRAPARARQKPDA